MLTIQEVGLSILGDTPGKFYILGGAEYGIKDKYIEILTTKIGPKIEYPTVDAVVEVMSKNHLIPLMPQVYVVRYDKSFVSQVTKELADKILSLDIIGTLVLIYEDVKDLGKLDKLFPENTASIDRVDLKHMCKYLHTDFPDLDKKIAELVAKHTNDYFQAKSICRCLNLIQGTYQLTEKQILSLFGLSLVYTAEDVQIAIASKNFNAMVYILDHYDSDPQGILYQILHVMVELDKCFDGKYVQSPLKKYAKNWSRSDVYYMFNYAYEAIKLLRSGGVVDVSDLIVWLSAVMVFKQIPNPGVFR